MAKRAFCDVYGIDAPVVLAGMAFVSDPTLVAAVSEAGGLGVLGTGPMPPGILREQIAEVRARTRRPFGVNQIVETTALGALTTEEDLRVLAEEEIPVVVFFWNPPPRAWLAPLEQAGARIWLTVTSVADAEAAVASGADALIVQGLEAGGHNRSTAALSSLLPQVARLAGERHVIAAGGIADARSAATAFGLGADAVSLGTRFVACAESPAHEQWKRRILEAGADDTTITRIFGPEWPGAPMRVLRNRAVEASLRAEPQHPMAPVGRTLLFGQRYDMPRCSSVLPTRATEGDLEEMCLAAGTSVAAIERVETAAEIVAEISRGLAIG